MATGANSLSLKLYKTYLKSLDWLFPPRCAGCGRLGHHWCPDCQSGVKRILGSTCPTCGLPKEEAKPCNDCRGHRPAFDQARAWARYDAALRPVVVTLKYRSDQGLSWVLAERLAGLPYLDQWSVSGVVPVPLAAERLRERGHNQAELLARPLARLTSLPLFDRALHRTRETPKQVGLSLHERRRNMQGAFEADSSLVAGRDWLLVDDVMTTGATLDAAAAALKAAGAAHVYALTLGRATL